ncbi:MAG: 16S rRNA (cytosine(1402)-N(4))-methyltransferase RsmH [Alphaproteobacteria bacterium]|nr:16S rRNA (cytosine(1402)-N(4))-methyltransferase RsmH [Alphaproteobacteria bacterium]MDY4690379.1 16S rRNA (cytosine(1402)-N(4))-methyltransferase RsmH [Alphaproteobacteria bacterium]
MPETRQKHIPVMLQEVLAALKPQKGEVYVDATFGNGCYTKAILEAADCKVIALDRDPTVKIRANEIKNMYGGRFEFRAGQFGDFADLVPEKINGAVFDIGVSSMQLDEAERGFSFSKEGALDMRMSQSGLSAKDIVNTYGEQELADLIYQYGEERKSRQIARQIAEYRKHKEIETTTELAEIIYKVIHKKFGEIDPATRTFQALRIAVNDELGELSRGLSGAANRLLKNGRLVVVDFHSLEDRIVKKFFNENGCRRVRVSKYAPELVQDEHLFAEVSKVIVPAAEECAQNPRARSAKLRYAIRG